MQENWSRNNMSAEKENKQKVKQKIWSSVAIIIVSISSNIYNIVKFINIVKTEAPMSIESSL